jgi:hypothetical protein
MRLKIEEVINEIKTNPHYDQCLRFALRDHYEKTHQMLLDALNNAVAFALLWTDEDHPVVRNSKATIEAAETMEFEE